MLAKLVATGAALAALLTAPLALADEGTFGKQGQFIFGADRLFSLFAYSQNIYGEPGGNVTISGASMSLLWGSNQVSGGTTGAFGAGNPTFYTAPRLGFDYVVIPHLTVGGELFAWFTLGGNQSTPVGNGATVSSPTPSGNEFGIAPRVGYVFDLNDVLAIWLRGGLSYYLGNVSVPGQTQGNPSNCTINASLDTFGLDLDPQLVISPVNHFAFVAGPALDWGFTGGYSATVTTDPTCNRSTSGNYNTLNFSITGGLVGWL
jgi:hypothetical protein